MSTAASAPVGISTKNPRKSVRERAGSDAATVGTSTSLQARTSSIQTKLESLVLLLTALLLLWLMVSIATQF